MACKKKVICRTERSGWLELTPPAASISENEMIVVAIRKSDVLIVAVITGDQKPEGAKEHYYK